jgi:hypothetical protein
MPGVPRLEEDALDARPVEPLEVRPVNAVGPGYLDHAGGAHEMLRRDAIDGVAASLLR